MCLIGIAHGVSTRFPLILAANRDEDYERPTRNAHFWDDAPDVFGGRDALHGGSWLAITRGGRFAAVTNLHGAVRAPQNRSRGALVRDFVTSSRAPLEYARDVERHVDEYTPFHLLVGEAGGDAVHVFERAMPLAPGVYGISNAPAGVPSPKIDAIVHRLRNVIDLDDANAIVDDLVTFLRSPDIFVAGERYGTRASTVIVASAEEILFVEKAETVTRALFRWELRDR